MPKIPRSRDNYVEYKPSAPVLAPMSLADYSAFSDALDKGAAFAAKKYHQKQDAEANLNRNIFANDGNSIFRICVALGTDEFLGSNCDH